jgi:hypothetical protein
MIGCTEFIPAYSELFKFLDEKGGPGEADAFWAYLAEQYLGPLRELVHEKGLRGCWEYWGHALNEEAADFTMELDEEAGLFRVEMHRCPSKGRLLQEAHLEPYHRYCEHCPALYAPILAGAGLDYEMDLSRAGEAACTFTARRRTTGKPGGATP